MADRQRFGDAGDILGFGRAFWPQAVVNRCGFDMVQCFGGKQQKGKAIWAARYSKADALFARSGNSAKITQKAGGGGVVESADLIHKAECAATRPEMSRALSPLW